MLSEWVSEWVPAWVSEWVSEWVSDSRTEKMHARMKECINEGANAWLNLLTFPACRPHWWWRCLGWASRLAMPPQCGSAGQGCHLLPALSGLRSKFALQPHTHHAPKWWWLNSSTNDRHDALRNVAQLLGQLAQLASMHCCRKYIMWPFHDALVLVHGTSFTDGAPAGSTSSLTQWVGLLLWL